MEFQLSYFKSSKVMLFKCCTQHASKFGKLSSGHRTGKRSTFILIPKDNAKECSNYCTIAPILYASMVMLKILQARLQQYVNWELPDVQAGCRKGRGTRDQIANICWITEKESSRKTSIFALLTTPKPSTVGITINWKILKNMGTPDHLTCLLRNLYTGQEATWNNRLVPNWERSMSRLYIVTLLI